MNTINIFLFKYSLYNNKSLMSMHMQTGRIAAEALNFSLIWFSGIQLERKSSA